MPVTRLRPYYVGETALLAAPQPTAYEAVVSAPDGSTASYVREGSNPVAVRLTSVGRWRCEWVGFSEEGFDVVAPPSVPSPTPTPTPKPRQERKPERWR